MDPLEAAAATAQPIHDIAANFMLDGNTYKRGAELGFEGVDFYVAGRGGVLGDTDADVVAAALVYFNPTHIRDAWERSQPVLPRLEAAAAFADCGHRWADDHLAEDVDWDRLADLATTVVDSASPGGAPVFAGWRRLAVPAASRPRALHQLNALRELRAAYHAASVLSIGLRPIEAFAVRSPYMAQAFGWTELPDAEASRQRWEEAEAATNRAMATALSVLPDEELSELAALGSAALAAVDRD